MSCYNPGMNLKLTEEQREAVAQFSGPVPIEDERTHRVYFLVDEATLATLRRAADREAIRQGIADMEAGHVITLDELDARIDAAIRHARPSHDL